LPVYRQPEILQVIGDAVVFADGGRERLQVSPQPSRMEPDWFLAGAR